MVIRVSLGAALILVAVAASGPDVAWAAAMRVPAPITRLQPTHRLAALTLRPASGFRAWDELGTVLSAEGAQATVFLTPTQIRHDAGALKTLRRAGQVEVGLTGAGSRPGGSLIAAGELCLRLLGDKPGLYQPDGTTDVMRASRDAYAAGFVTILWSRSADGDVTAPAPWAQEVQAGEIVRLNLPRDASALVRLKSALAVVRARGIALTTASALLEDQAGHLEYCKADGGAQAPERRSAGNARPELAQIYPEAALTARTLWHLGRPGEYAVRRLYGVRAGVRLSGRPMEGLLPGEVRAIVQREAKVRYVAPQRATISHPDGTVVADRTGRRLDVAATLRLIQSAAKGTSLEPIMRVIHARWRTDDIAGLTDVLARYRTWIDGSAGRYMNVQKGAGRINNRIVFPGEIFSTLGVIGDVSRQKGWYRAPVIVWGGYTEGVGGGLCQVSSTLYNAVSKAQLKIVERHHHAKQVHYVPRGRDATIAWPALDFRFANDRDTPIVLKAYVRGGALWTEVLGKAKAEPSTGT